MGLCCCPAAQVHGDNRMRQILKDVFQFADTCNVYVIRKGTSAVLVDFGSGDVLSHLSKIGVESVTDILITHHHRDQCQGLRRAVEAGIRVWVPHTEQDLFQDVDAHWQSRAIYNNYNMRQDRFSLLDSVPVSGTLKDYETRRVGDILFTVVPTPGHTTGSVSLMTELGGKQIAFTGDLIAGPGKVWDMAATQWSYNGTEGVDASILSLLDLQARKPDLLLPSHGEVMADPNPAVDLLVERLWGLLQLRRQQTHLLEHHRQPYVPVTPHLLRHRASVANTYVLLSESHKACFLDFGYDFATGFIAGSDRASRRPWLHSLPMLKQQFNVEKIDVVIPTHFHDDHVAGFNLLRQVEGTQVWAAQTFADILENPARYDLPCLWYDPIPVDCHLPLEIPITWEEYTLTLYPLAGHTLYAVAISLEVDGKRVLVTGDQYQGGAGLELNYVYANHFQITDYVNSAQLYRQLNPDIILSGHWHPLQVTPEYLDQIEQMGSELERLHRELLPENPDRGTEGTLVRVYPYQAAAGAGKPVEYQVDVHNPFDHPSKAEIQLVLPEGWHTSDDEVSENDFYTSPNAVRVFDLPPGSTQSLFFQVIAPPDFKGRRARIAVDITLDGQRFGQQAEALVSAV